jgi:hypothetical protein
MSKYAIPVNGAVFGRWVVLRPVENYGRFQRVLCRCVCGVEKALTVMRLHRGETKSCKACAAKYRYDGHLHIPDSPLRRYWSNRWHSMHDRCYNTASKGYPYYGGRGIAVCGRWHDQYNFLDDIQKVPGWDQVLKGRLDIDREDNNGPYSLDNVRLVPRRINARNKRNTHRLVHTGELLAAGDIQERFGLVATFTTIQRWIIQGHSLDKIRELDQKCSRGKYQLQSEAKIVVPKSGETWVLRAAYAKDGKYEIRHVLDFTGDNRIIYLPGRWSWHRSRADHELRIVTVEAWNNWAAQGARRRKDGEKAPDKNIRGCG